VKLINIKFGKQQEIKIEHKQGWFKAVPMQHCTKHAQGILHAVEPQVQNYADDEPQAVKRYSEGGRRKLI